MVLAGNAGMAARGGAIVDRTWVESLNAGIYVVLGQMTRLCDFACARYVLLFEQPGIRIMPTAYEMLRPSKS